MTLKIQSPESTSLLNYHKVIGEDLKLLTDQLISLAKPRFPKSFPGSLCVSLERENIGMIQKKEYWVCEKTDGFRFLMFITRFKGLKLVLLIGRNMGEDMYVIGMKNVPRGMYQGTVLDGEIVVDKRSGQTCFMIFDCLATEGINVSQKKFSERITMFTDSWKDYSYDESDPLIVFPKKFFEMPDFGTRFMEHMEATSAQFPLDGIIFTPEDLPIIQGRHYKLFKWKRPCDHTVDFSLRALDGALLACEAGQQGKGVLVECGRLVESPSVPVSDGAICECKCVDPVQSAWTFVKVRTDKTYPNDTVTFQKTMKNIHEGLDLPELFSAFEKII